MNVGDVIEGKYEIKRLMGEGGMGAVYEARHKRIGRRLALKTLHAKLATNKEMVERFLREAQAAAAVGSEYIIDITDAGETADGIPYLVMEYLEGQDLAEIIRAQAPLEPTLAAYLMHQVCLGVSAAHEQGIVHRDLKPQNIFVTRRTDGSPWVKVLDFGIAKLRASLVEEVPELTSSGAIMGTPYYMAPEQAQGAKAVDHRVDIYSAGVLLFELLSGVRPFDGSNYNELIVRVATTSPKSLTDLRPELDEALVQVVGKAMARDAGQRYQTMSDFARAMEPFTGRQSLPSLSLDLTPSLSSSVQRTNLPKTSVQTAEGDASKHLPPTMATVGPPEAGEAPRRSRRWLGVGLAVLGVAVVAGGALMIWGTGESGDRRSAIAEPLPVSEPGDGHRDPSKNRSEENAPGDAAPSKVAEAPVETAPVAEGSAGGMNLGPEPARRPAALSSEDEGIVETGPRAGMELGNRCFKHIGAKRYDAARAACYRALDVAANDSIRGALYYNLGRVEENEGRIDNARWYYRRSLQVRPGNESVAKRLALITSPGIALPQ